MTILSPWYWCSLPLQGRTGSDIFTRLFRAETAIATLLESPHPSSDSHPQLTRYSLCAGPPRRASGQWKLWTPPQGKILTFLRQRLQVGQQGTTPSLPEAVDETDFPFIGGWLGWLGFDVAREIEQLPCQAADPLPFPVAYWYEPEAFAVLDHHQQLLWLAASDHSQLEQLHRQLDQPLTLEQEETKSATSQLAAVSPNSYRFLTQKADFETAVRLAQQYIQAGDIFQVNLSARFLALTQASSWSIYRCLQTINPSPFASYWQTPWGALISCSPERLVHLQQRQAQTRPIAGTRPRGLTPQQDQQLAQELLANAKEQAEHIMLVDLERNDLGKVCQWGSVQVDELLTIERYSHVMHLVSNIQGTLQPKCDAIDLIRALFPGGTISGCPKVRSLEIIEELEPWRRNLFYGSCGYLDQRGNLDLNILIRSLLWTKGNHQSDQIWGQVGAGIVADSHPEQEWFESLQKAEAQLSAVLLSH